MKEASMAEVTVKQLADVVGIPVDKLLTQMKDAGLSHAGADQVVTDDEKQALLAHLKRSHGEQQSVQKKITLKRKSVSKLKVSGNQGGRSKTVNVEVRKKRTYVKRDAAESDDVADDVDDVEDTFDTVEEVEVEVAVAEIQVEEPVVVKQEPPKVLSAQEEAKLQKERALSRAAESKRNAEKASREAQAPKRKLAPPKAQDEKAAGKAGAAKLKLSKEDIELDEKQKAILEAKSVADKKKRDELEKAAKQATLAQAEKVAEELDQRKGEQVDEKEKELDLGTSIVKAAYEESFTREDRGVKKESSARRQARKAKRVKRKQEHAFAMPVEKEIHVVKIGETIAVAELAQRMKLKGVEVVKALMKNGVMVNVNQEIDQDTAILIVEEMGHKYSLVSDNALEEQLIGNVQREGEEVGRAPVVTIMGHVDHGKTSLLDYIRSTQVASGEAGGITQHIGAYHVETDKGMISFLDTPGHAAFSAMRSRGANCTDIVVIVVAADDGVMPQTEEAIEHAQAANVPIIIAVNKIDKEGADIERVKTELSQKEIIPEEWGGEHQFIEVSAHTGQGVGDLLDAILLQSELLELKAMVGGPAEGVVIEARLDKGRGTVCSLLVQNGQLSVGDLLLAGQFYGRVRAMLDENGKPMEHAGPSIPVEILGLSGAPNSGDEFCVVADERKARMVADQREAKERKERFIRQQASNLESLFQSMGKEDAAQVNVVLKGDVKGSVEALVSSLTALSTDEVQVSIVSRGVGGINESDINLAKTSNAVVLGFNVRADAAGRQMAQDEGIEIRYYSIIYELIDDVKAAMSGLLSPELREEILGVADVREVYRSSKFGAAAGCMVLEGTVYRNRPIRVLRDDVVVFEGELESLRRFKDDVNEVKSGTECGIAVKSYNDIKAGDKIEIFQVNEIARTL